MSEEVKRCRHCHEPIIPDGYDDWVHEDLLYMCEGKEGEVATP